MFDTFSKNSLVPLLVRLGLAVVFIYHGLEKVSGPDHEAGLKWMHKPEDKPDAPEPPSPLMQGLIAWGELVGGLAMAIGFLTRFAAIGLGILMAGAIVTVTGPNGFSSLNHGYEYNFVLLVLCACALLLGSGQIGADHLFRLRRKQ